LPSGAARSPTTPPGAAVPARLPARGKAKNPLEILLSLGNRLGAGWTFAGEASVFRALAETEAPFAGMSYESIGIFGQGIRE